MEVGRPWPGRDEAVIPLGKNGATGGITVINEFHIMAVDPDGTRKVVNDYIIPAIAKSLEATATAPGCRFKRVSN